MSDFKNKRKTRKLIYSKISLLIALAIVIFMSMSTYNIYKKYRESADNKKGAMGELSSLEQRNKELSSRIDRLKTDRGLEEEIRKKFNVAKEGEGVVIIVPKSSTSSDGNSESGGTLLDKLIGIFRIF